MIDDRGTNIMVAGSFSECAETRRQDLHYFEHACSVDAAPRLISEQSSAFRCGMVDGRNQTVCHGWSVKSNFTAVRPIQDQKTESAGGSEVHSGGRL